jgi:3-oxoacyl-[acyl-carrier-protein] synthase III
MPEALAVRGAVGVALPSRVVPTAEIAERLGVTEQWIESRTGVRERRFAASEDRLADLAAAAGLDALERTGFSADSIDLVIVATCTADQPMPATAPLVAGLLGAVNAGAFDVNSACTGFLVALDLACGQIEAGRAQRVLVIGADLMSRLVDPDDRRTAALFGDGAGAMVVDGRLIGPTVLGTDAAGAPAIRSGYEPASLRMDGHDTFKAAVARLSEVTLEAVAAARVSLEEIDLFVYHQANARILHAVGERLALAPERVVNAIGTLGNTSAASIPLALAAAEQDGSLRPGARVLLAAFGAGFTWGATTLTWKAGDALPIPLQPPLTHA